MRRDEISRDLDKRGRKMWKNTKNRVRLNGGLAAITENHPPSRIPPVRHAVNVFVDIQFHVSNDVGNIMDQRHNVVTIIISSP